MRLTDPELVLCSDPEEVSFFGDHVLQFTFVDVGRKARQALPFRFTRLAFLQDVAGQRGSTAVVWLLPLNGGTCHTQLGDTQVSGGQWLFCSPQKLLQ